MSTALFSTSYLNFSPPRICSHKYLRAVCNFTFLSSKLTVAASGSMPSAGGDKRNTKLIPFFFGSFCSLNLCNSSTASRSGFSLKTISGISIVDKACKISAELDGPAFPVPRVCLGSTRAGGGGIQASVT